MNQDEAVAGVLQVVIWIVLGLLALGALSIVLAIAVSIRERLRLNAALREYEELQRTHGAADARERCPHRVFTVGHTDYAVLTASDKWCRTCGKHLGVARLKKSMFGHRWE